MRIRQKQYLLKTKINDKLKLYFLCLLNVCHIDTYEFRQRKNEMIIHYAKKIYLLIIIIII